MTKLDWWNSSLTSVEQSRIAENFQPMGNLHASKMIDSCHAIGILIGHLKKPALRDLGYKLVKRADLLAVSENNKTRLHFWYASRGGYFYRWRDLDDFALDEAARSFERQILISQEAKDIFQTVSHPIWPIGHKGYDQLRIIREKQGDFIEALKLCHRASAEGWWGDWEKHITRLEKKEAKRS